MKKVFLFVLCGAALGFGQTKAERDKAVHDLRRVLELKFDMSPRIALPRGGTAPADIPPVEKLTVQLDGQRAMVQVPRSVSAPMIFVDERWRFDMSRMPELYKLSREEIMRQDKEVTTIYRAVSELASKGTFKTFGTATILIAGIETMHMIKKGQLSCPGGLAFSAADYFYSLAS